VRGHGENDDWCWLNDIENAAKLLAEPDPGPTPWLIENLIIDGELVAAVGRWKTTKSYALLDMGISVTTGRPLFGKLKVQALDLQGEPSQERPVLYVSEESGRIALRRRLDALCRGRAIDPAELKHLDFSTNKGVKLDSPRWQNEILDAVDGVGYYLIIFDPLSRMIGAERDENLRTGLAGTIEFLRELRDATQAAVCFVHHTGHTGEHMRGTSDLESVWETKLTWKREGQSSLVTIASEHREAEAGDPISYRIAWDHDTRSMRFNLEQDPLQEAVRAYMREHPDASANEVDENVEGTRKKKLAIVKQIRAQGGSDSPEPPANHPLPAPSEGGSSRPLFRGAGTTTEEPGSNGAEPPLSEEEVERLAALFHDMEPEPAEEEAT